jgi:hypothetical protein
MTGGRFGRRAIRLQTAKTADSGASEERRTRLELATLSLGS